MHYYQFNIADYRKDTTHLKPIEHYIYRTLIDWYYLNESQIPKETQTVLRRLGLDTEFEPNLLNVLSDFFILTDFGWSHKRIDEEIVRYASICNKNATNGKLGGRPKKSESKPKKTQSVIFDNRNESEKKPNQEPITNNQEPLKNQRSKSLVSESKNENVDEKNQKPFFPLNAENDNKSPSDLVNTVISETKHADPPDKSRGSRLDKDLQLPLDWLQWAMNERPTARISEIRKEFESFKDYWVSVPGQKGRKVDWFATWRNCIRQGYTQPKIQQKQKFNSLDYINGGDGYGNRRDNEQGNVIDIGASVANAKPEIQGVVTHRLSVQQDGNPLPKALD